MIKLTFQTTGNSIKLMDKQFNYRLVNDVLSNQGPYLELEFVDLSDIIFETILVGEKVFVEGEGVSKTLVIQEVALKRSNPAYGVTSGSYYLKLISSYEPLFDRAITDTLTNIALKYDIKNNTLNDKVVYIGEEKTDTQMLRELWDRFDTSSFICNTWKNERKYATMKQTNPVLLSMQDGTLVKTSYFIINNLKIISKDFPTSFSVWDGLSVKKVEDAKNLEGIRFSLANSQNDYQKEQTQNYLIKQNKYNSVLRLSIQTSVLIDVGAKVSIKVPQINFSNKTLSSDGPLSKDYLVTRSVFTHKGISDKMFTYCEIDVML